MTDLGLAFVAVVLLIGAGWFSVMRDSDLALVIAAVLFVISVVVVIGAST